MTRHLATIAALATVLLATPAASQQRAFDDGWTSPPRQEPQSFNGSFFGFGARLGSTSVADSDWSGYSIDVGPRMAFAAYVGDLRLGYRYDHLGEDLSVHSISPSLAIHPLYLVLLGNGWLWYTIASLYIDAGVSLQFASTPDHLDPALAFHWGAGIDIPVWSPDILGHGLWINLLYRNLRGSLELPDTPSRSLSQHTLFLGLEWRTNTLPF